VSADGVPDAVNESAAGLYYFTKPLLAFLGGFSARVVYRILTRLVEALESFVDGSAKDALAAREQVARMQLDQQLEKMRQDHAASLGADRLKLAMQLISMKENLAKGSGNNAEIALALDELLQEAMQPVGSATAPSPMDWPGTQPAPGTFDQPVAPQQPLPAFPQNPPVNPVQPGNGDFVLPDFPEFRAETKPNNS
jgi:hypothetical protein